MPHGLGEGSFGFPVLAERAWVTSTVSTSERLYSLKCCGQQLWVQRFDALGALFVMTRFVSAHGTCFAAFFSASRVTTIETQTSSLFGLSVMPHGLGGRQLWIFFPCRSNMCDFDRLCRGMPAIPTLFWAASWGAAVQCSWCIVCHDTFHLCTRDMFCSLSLCMPVCNNPNTDCAGLSCTGVATWICGRELRAFFPGRACMGAQHSLPSKCVGRSVQRFSGSSKPCSAMQILDACFATLSNGNIGNVYLRLRQVLP